MHALSGKKDDLPWDVFQYFDSAYDLTSSKLWYDLGYADEYLSTMDRGEARKRLEIARDVARQAWFEKYSNNDDKAAIGKWKQVFGERFPAYG